jgi:hypothetical protein
VIDVIRNHGSDDTEVIRTARNVWEEFADLGTRLPVFRESVGGAKEVAGFSAFELRFFEGERFPVHFTELGFGVKGVDVRRAAGHEKKNDAFGFRRKMGACDERGLA